MVCVASTLHTTSEHGVLLPLMRTPQALEQLQEMETSTGGQAAIYTDSKVTIDSLKNHATHGYLIEKIRNMIRHLATQNWNIHFKWVKAHIGIEGNEIADKLAKEAAHDDKNPNIEFARIPITSLASDINKTGLEQWQQQWTNTTKGDMCRSFFPRLEQRLKIKMPIIPEFTALVTGHGKTKAYLHRFKLADDPMCQTGRSSSKISSCFKLNELVRK